MEKMGYGKDYKYAHNYEGHFVKQQYLPDALKGARFYCPQSNAQEDRLKAHLQSLWGDRFK